MQTRHWRCANTHAKNATDLLQPVAPSGLIQVDIIAVSDYSRLPTDCSELTVSDWNSLLGCQGCISVKGVFKNLALKKNCLYGRRDGMFA